MPGEEDERESREHAGGHGRGDHGPDAPVRSTIHPKKTPKRSERTTASGSRDMLDTPVVAKIAGQGPQHRLRRDCMYPLKNRVQAATKAVIETSAAAASAIGAPASTSESVFHDAGTCQFAASIAQDVIIPNPTGPRTAAANSVDFSPEGPMRRLVR